MENYKYDLDSWSIEGANEKELIDEKQSKLTLWVFLFFVQPSPIAIINYICKK